MNSENRRGLFPALSILLFLYFAVMGVSLLLNGSIGAQVLESWSGQWRNDPAYPLIRSAYGQLLGFLIPGALLALATLIVSIKDYHRTYHESSLCMIIASCLMMVINVIPGLYIALFDQVLILNYYNILMYSGPFDLQKLYPLYAILLAVAATWIFRTVYRFRQTPEPGQEAEKAA